MTDLTVGAALGGIPFAARAVPDQASALPTQQVNIGAANQGADQTEKETAELVSFLPGPKIDESTLAGPPPAFKVSLIELDRALQESLARINAEMGFGAPEVQPPGAEPRTASSDEAKQAQTSQTGETAQGERAEEQEAPALFGPSGPASQGTDGPDMPGAPAVTGQAITGEAQTGAKPVMMGQVPGATVELPSLDGELA